MLEKRKMRDALKSMYRTGDYQTEITVPDGGDAT